MDRRTFLELSSLTTAGLLMRVNLPCLRDEPRTQNGFRLLTVEGSARERGRAHGEALRDSIRELVAPWKQALSPPQGSSPDEYVTRFLGETRFDEAIARDTPDLMEEIRGIAEGSGQPFATIFAMQLVDEEWCYATAREWPDPPDQPHQPPGDKCSVIATARSAAHTSIVAQNLDVPDYPKDHMVLLRVKDPQQGLDAMVVTMAGLIALNGMNAHGVAVCVNALLPLRSARTGLPVACVIRGALARRSLADAARFVQDVRHASGQCYTIADPGGIACLEASAGKVTRAFPEQRTLAHTNHPLVNDDLNALGRWATKAQEPPPGLRNSRARHAACEKRLADLGGDAVATIKAALGSHDSTADPVCRHHAPGSGFSAACTIYELTAAAPTLHLAPNPPCRAAFAEHSFG